MLNDVRFAIRVLLRSPGFTLAAVVVLTLGIGATTTMFGATNSVLLKPLPYSDPDRLFVLRETRPTAGFERTVLAMSEYLNWARDSTVVQDATIVSYPGLAISINRAPAERLPALQVSADFFRLFGIVPVTGRAFTRDAELPGHGDVLLISHRIWQERFGGTSDVVGRTVRLEGRPTTIIGVLPRGFSFQMRVDLMVPMTLTPALAAQDFGHSFDVFARLAPGVSREQAIAELSRTALGAQGPTNHLTGATLVPLKEMVVGDAQAPMLIMFGAVGFVLLIACANIANLLLARGAARQREIAIRSALGAGRGRVVRQLITESLLLSAIGGVSGALLATWLTELLAKGAAGSLPRADEIHVDARAFAFALAVAVVAGLLFGLAPAWQASRTDVNSTLKQEARGSSGGRQRALGLFVIGEVALAMMLLIGAILLLTTFRQLRRVDPGFDPRHALVVPAFLPDWKYQTTGQQRAFFQRAATELAALPGVEAVGATNALPFSGDNSSGSLTIEGQPPPTPATRPNADRRSVTPGYFAAMGMHVRAGRAFTTSDDERAPLVVIVSRAFAERYWPGQDAVGKRLKLGRYESDPPLRTVVGIVENVRHRSLQREARPVVYYPHAQGPDGGMQIIVRSSGSPASIAGSVREAMKRLDPDLPVTELRPLTELVAGSLADAEIALSLLGTFALMAIALASAGIYGVMAYTVAQRRMEFGIRLALGASRRDLLTLVGRQGIRLTAIGVASGLAGAWLTSSVLRDMIYGVRPTDPAIYVGAACVLSCIALAACVVPALRAMRVDPIVALRAE
jgi:putative ABC transport system permease protein